MRCAPRQPFCVAQCSEYWPGLHARAADWLRRSRMRQRSRLAASRLGTFTDVSLCALSRRWSACAVAGEMPTVRIDADRRTTRAYGGRALHEALEAEHEGTSSKIGEVIVNTLGRDHTLRHAYLRMRWHRDLALTSI